MVRVAGELSTSSRRAASMAILVAPSRAPWMISSHMKTLVAANCGIGGYFLRDRNRHQAGAVLARGGSRLDPEGHVHARFQHAFRAPEIVHAMNINPFIARNDARDD